MYGEEEKIKNAIKLTIFFLITMLGIAILDSSTIIVLLLFHIAFIKD